MKRNLDGQHYGPEVFDGYHIEATKRTETMWHVVSHPYSLMVIGEDFKHAIVTPMSNGMSTIRPRFSSAPDVPEAHKAAILKAISSWNIVSANDGA